MKTIVLCTGGWDPLHSGHIDYIRAAKELGDIMVVGVNSDPWLVRKKGRAFMPFSERSAIIRSLACVDAVIDFNDDDGSARDAIKKVRAIYPECPIIFANGGDRTSTNIPEMDIKDNNLIFKFGVGGTNKANSSSWILEEWRAPKTERQWGYYRVLHDVPGMKVKELTVNPGKKLSMQRHANRSEYWIVSEGVATVNIGNPPTMLNMLEHQTLTIPVGEWHQLCNSSENPVRIVEIQYGEQCIEEDIERVDLQ